MRLNSFKKGLLGIIVLLFLAGNVSLHARLVWNSSEIAFEEKIDEVATQATTTDNLYTLKELIIISAGHFFSANSFINLLSENIELSDIEKTDILNSQMICGNAIESINITWSYYQQLTKKAYNTPYKNDFIEKLTMFNYDTFQENNGLVQDVFKDVKSYLAAGNVRATFTHAVNSLEKIYMILKEVQSYLYRGVMPPNNIMWNLNQECSRTMLFGQYVARVFEELK